jgi:hypothetical protein
MECCPTRAPISRAPLTQRLPRRVICLTRRSLGLPKRCRMRAKIVNLMNKAERRKRCNSYLDLLLNMTYQTLGSHRLGKYTPRAWSRTRSSPTLPMGSRVSLAAQKVMKMPHFQNSVLPSGKIQTYKVMYFLCTQTLPRTRALP